MKKPSKQSGLPATSTPEEINLMLDLVMLAQKVHEGDEAALRRLLRILHSGITSLNNCGNPPPLIYQKVAAREIEWPVLVGRHPHQRAENIELMEKLGLSNQSTPAMILPKGQKRPWDTESPVNRIALRLFSEINSTRQFFAQLYPSVKSAKAANQSTRKKMEQMVQKGNITEVEGAQLVLMYVKQDLALSLPPLTKKTAGKWGYASLVWMQLKAKHLAQLQTLQPDSTQKQRLKKLQAALAKDLQLLAEWNPDDPDKAILWRLTSAYKSIAPAIGQSD